MNNLDKQASRLFLQFPSSSLLFCFWSQASPVQKVFFGFATNCMKLLSVFRTVLKTFVGKSSIKKWLRQYLFAKLKISDCKSTPASTLGACKWPFNFTKFIDSKCLRKSEEAGDSSGFILLWLTLLAPVLLGALTVVASLMILQLQKQKNVQLCRDELLEIQSLAKLSAKKLLSLNPQALHLRIQLHQVNLQILAATAAGQFTLVTALKARRLLIRAQQQSLDLTQKKILQSTKSQMNLDLSLAHFKVRQQLENQRSQLSAFAQSKFHLAARPKVTFAFKPTDQLLAPQYEPYLNFEAKQSLALSWLQEFQWGPIMKIFSFPVLIRSQCRVTLKEIKWEPIIQRDRL